MNTFSKKIISLILTMIMVFSMFTSAIASVGAAESVYCFGDVNMDGIVSINDTTLVQLALAKLKSFNVTQKYLCDVDCSGDLNINDASYIQRYLTKSDYEFPLNDDGFSIGEQITFTEETTVTANDATETTNEATEPTVVSTEEPSTAVTTESTEKVTTQATTATTAQTTATTKATTTATTTKVNCYFPACSSSQTSIVDALASIGVDSSKAYRTVIASANGITDYTGTADQNTKMLALLKSGLLINPDYDGTLPPTHKYYNDYSTITTITDRNSCTAMQGLAVGSTYLYTVKILSDNTKAILAKTNKNTGTTTYLTNSTTGYSYFTNLGHANGMCVATIDSKSNLFVVTMNKNGAYALVRLEVNGSKATVKGQYKLSGGITSASAISILESNSSTITFLFKVGKKFYKGSLSKTATSGTITTTKVFTINIKNIIVNGVSVDASTYTHQGLGLYKNKIFVPLWNDEHSSQSIVAVYDISNMSGTLTSDPYLSFRITSSTYNGGFEIEDCGISSSDGKLYFNTNRWKSGIGTCYDGIHYFKSYTFS